MQEESMSPKSKSKRATNHGLAASQPDQAETKAGEVLPASPSNGENPNLLSLDEKDEAITKVAPFPNATAVDDINGVKQRFSDRMESFPKLKESFTGIITFTAKIKDAEARILQAQNDREVAQGCLASHNATFSQLVNEDRDLAEGLLRWHLTVKHASKALKPLLPTITGFARDHNFPVSSVHAIVNKLEEEHKAAQQRLQEKIQRHQEEMEAKARKEAGEEEDEVSTPLPLPPASKATSLPFTVKEDVVDESKPSPIEKCDDKGRVTGLAIRQNGKETPVQSPEDFYLWLDLKHKHLFNAVLSHLKQPEDLARWLKRLDEVIFLNHNHSDKQYDFHAGPVQAKEARAA